MTNKNTNPAAKPKRQTFSADYKLRIVAEEHSGRWEVTYEHGDECPYHARHRVSGDSVATRDLALLDRALRSYVVPPADRSVARCRRGQTRFAALTWTRPARLEGPGAGLSPRSAWPPC